MVFTGVVLTACTATPIPAASATPTPISAGTPTSLSAEAILEMANTAMRAVDFVHLDMGVTMTSIEGELYFGFQGDFQAPDRFRGVRDTMMSLAAGFEGVGHLTEDMSIGGTFYQEGSSTEYAEYWEVASAYADPLADPTEFIGGDLPEFRNLVLAGEETLDGVPVYHLKGKAPPGAFESVEGELDADIWIRVDDSALVRITLEGEAQVEGLWGDSDASSATVSMTMKFSDFGKPVVIEVPNEIISVGEHVKGSIEAEAEEEVDFFNFAAEGGQVYIITVELGTLEDSALVLWDGDIEAVLAHNNDYGDTLGSRIEWTCPASGVYYISVVSADLVSTGTYTLTVQLGPPPA